MPVPLRVLLVEDEETDALLLLRQLRQAGYKPQSERVDTEAAMAAALDRQSWDIVLADYALPGFSGMAALKLVQDRGLDLPFILVSGKIGEEEAVAAMKAGAHDYVMKDRLARLVPAVQRELQEAEIRRERRQAEDAFRESEERYRGLVEASPDVIGQLDLELNFLMVNQVAEELFGFRSYRELLGKNLLELIDPPDRERAAAQMQTARHNGTVKNVVYTFRKRDGTPFWGEINASLTRDANGNPEAFTGAIRDVSERKKAQLALEQSLNKLQRMLDGITRSFAAAVETRDPYTAGHQKRVAHLARAIAEEMELPADCAAGIQVMGFLHDIGKIAIPAEILTKPGKINEHEFNLIKNHPRIGFDILNEIEFPWPVAEAILQHHERLDGSGYPFRLKDEEIILEARILAVADVVEAMSSHRPYRPALGLEKALAEIAQQSGLLYDQEVAAACVSLFSKGKFYWRETEPAAREG